MAKTCSFQFSKLKVTRYTKNAESNIDPASSILNIITFCLLYYSDLYHIYHANEFMDGSFFASSFLACFIDSGLYMR